MFQQCVNTKGSSGGRTLMALYHGCPSVLNLSGDPLAASLIELMRL